MTKRELQEIQHFLSEMNDAKQEDDVIDVYGDIYRWARKMYHTQGKQKLEEYNKNL